MQLFRKLLPISALILGLTFMYASADPGASVESFNPTGEVKGVRQVAARFSEAMVAFGDPRLESPFDVQCDAKGHGHWADGRNWLYDFEGDLPAGLKCKFSTRAKLKTLSGNDVRAASFDFSTGGPAVVISWPSQGSEYIDEDQVFMLGLDTVADNASVREHAYCSIDGLGERVPLQIFEGKERQQVLTEQKKRANNFFLVLTKRAKLGLLSVKDKRLDDAPSVVVARCARKLVAQSKVSIVWGAGIRSQSGIATAKEQILPFHVREEFSVKSNCERVNANAGCIPVLPISLNFTAPVDVATAAAIELRTADGKVVHPVLEQGVPAVETVRFNGPFAARSEVTISLPAKFQDDGKRALVNAATFPLKIRIDDDPPLIKFSSHFGILEANASPALPVSVRNVEATLKGLQAKVGAEGKAEAKAEAKSNSSGAGQLARVDADSDQSIANWLNRVLVPPHESDKLQQAFLETHKRPASEGEIPLLFGANASDFKATALSLPRADGPRPFELMGIPLPTPGFYVVEFASKRLGQSLLASDQPYYAYSSALVTNMGVHFKLGRESSLAWVTRLDNGKPMADARVSVSTCDGDPLWSGKTDGNGVVQINEQLPTNYYLHDCSGLLIVARKDQDMSFALTKWSNGIMPWEFNLGGHGATGTIIAHTVFDRPLFRAGETVSMKHFVRNRAGAGFDGAKADQMPTQATLTHNGSGQSYDVPVQWRAGAGISSWQIPKEAKLGSYTVSLHLGTETQETGSIRVEQYRVPLMKAVLKPPAKPLIQASSVDIDAQLSYLSGGVAAGAPVKFRSRLVNYPLLFPDYDDFRFGGIAPKEGIDAVAPYSYDPEADSDSDADAASGADVPAGVAGYPVRTRSATLDGSGGTRVNFAGLPKTDQPRALEVEMEYADPNGQILTASTRVLVLPSALVLGMQVSGGYATRDSMVFKVLALDAQGKLQVGRKVSVDAYSRKTYAYRKRLLGGFYAYEQTAEIKRLGEICSGKTDAHGLLSCSGEAPAGGELLLVANAKDDGGNLAQATNELYVADADNWYAAASNDRIDVLPERRDYQPGETARFEVRMPFREATALVTVEREGVLYSKVVTINASSPFIEVPVAKNFGPNAYVSVMVVRGRIDPESPGRFAWLRRLINRIGVFLGLAKKLPPEIDTHPTALVDLTKPAFKLGIAQIRVGWDAYELKVKVTPEKQVYKIRDRAVVNVHVSDAAGKPAANAEIALAAVDEGLLSLAAPGSWKLLEAMMQRRPEEVVTSTAQSQVIGKRHFGKKSAAPGGGGGGAGANARELFDTLLLWKPSVQLDAHGNARIEVPLNDSLTAFRIEAIAHAGTMQFGSASATISTTQEVMLFAGLPPFVREGDQFAAMVTVRNAGERPLTLDVNANMLAGASEKPVGTQRVSLKAGEASTLSFAATVPFDVDKLKWAISAAEPAVPGAAAAPAAHDALTFVQTVGAAYPVRLYQQTLEQLQPGKPLTLPVQMPAGAVAGRGGLDVRLVNSLGGDLGGMQEWIRRYPYTCLEQRTSAAVVLSDAARWQSTMNSLPSYLDGDGLARYFPTTWLAGDDALTSYILTIADETGYEIPTAARDQMLRGLENFVAGRIHRYGSLQTADVVIRKLAAIDALARHGHAKPAMLEALEIAPNLWPSSGVIDWISVLMHMADIPERDAKLAEAKNILRSRLMYSGTTMSFSTEKSDYLWWLMVSPDVNAVRALRLLADDPTFAADDAGRLARGALGRQVQGRWSTTLANAWGVVALRHFRQRYERDPVNGNTNATMGDQERRLDWRSAVTGKTGDPTLGTPTGDGLATHFAWPPAPAKLALEHQGGGKPWAFIAARAALPLTKPLFAGYQIKRSVTPIEQKQHGVWQPGDSYRVTLEIDAQSDRTWVVVNDPVPTGASILGSGLGGDSAQLAAGTKSQGWQRPAFEERAFDGFRAYYSYVPKGKFTIEYSVRLNNPGHFEMPAARVEAMYAPEVYAEVPVAKVDVVAATK